MKTSSKFHFFSLVFVLIGFVSCLPEEKNVPVRNSEDLKEETITDFYFQDLDDLSGVALAAPAADQYTGGRGQTTITIEDHRFSCEGIVISIEPGENSTPENPNGLLTVNFGSSGCKDLKGNIRKGKVMFAYTGKRFMPNSTVVTTLEGYIINNIKLEGVITSTNVASSTEDAPEFNVVLKDGRAIFGDESVANRESDITWSWLRAENPLNDKLIVHAGSTASGKTRNGTVYHVMVSDQMEYQRSCAIAVAGIKAFTLNNETEIIIDFGEGSCDRVVTVSAGKSEQTVML